MSELTESSPNVGINKKSNHSKTYAETRLRWSQGKLTEIRTRNGILKMLKMQSGTVYFIDNKGCRRKATKELLEDVETQLREMDMGVRNATKI